jgi:hypothetical protein
MLVVFGRYPTRRRIVSRNGRPGIGLRTARRGRSAAALSLLGLVVLLPGVVRTEGGVRLLDCIVTRMCDAEGICEAASSNVIFRMEPVAVGADGSGRYALGYEDIEVAMEAQSVAGPFFWTLPAERNALLPSSETQFLWHRLTLDPEPHASIRFLMCIVHQ